MRYHGDAYHQGHGGQALTRGTALGGQSGMGVIGAKGEHMDDRQRVINLISEVGGDNFIVPVINIDFVRFANTAFHLHLKSGKILTQDFRCESRDVIWAQIQQAISGVPQ